MKILIFICSFILITFAEHQFHKKTPAEVKAAREECWNEWKLTEDQREAMKKYEYPDVEAIHQAVKCTGIKLNVWCSEYGFHKNDLITQFGEGATPIFEKCITKKNDEDSVEKWAWHDWKCFVDSGLKEHFKNLEQ